jgi:hypothetical protein
MNDDETLAMLRSSLTGVKESLTDVRLDRPADAIRARARGRRLRRGLAGAGAGGLALGVGLVLAAGGLGAPARSVHVNLDAWSVDTLPNGLVYLDVRELSDPVRLRQTLASAGVPALVTFGDFCLGSSGGDPGDLDRVIGKAAPGGKPELTINPAEIPAGSELSIGIVSISKRGQKGLETSFALVKADSRLTCGVPKPWPGAGEGKKGPGTPVGPGKAKAKPAG